MDMAVQDELGAFPLDKILQSGSIDQTSAPRGQLAQRGVVNQNHAAQRAAA